MSCHVTSRWKEAEEEEEVVVWKRDVNLEDINMISYSEHNSSRCPYTKVSLNDTSVYSALLSKCGCQWRAVLNPLSVNEYR